MHKQQGWPQVWEYCKAKQIQTLGIVSQGVNWSWSQCIKSHQTQTSSGKSLPSYFWNRNVVRSILPGLRRKRTGASFIKCCAETILKYILRSFLKYAYVWFIEWMYVHLSDVKSMNHKLSGICAQLNSFTSLLCKQCLINVIDWKEHLTMSKSFTSSKDALYFQKLAALGQTKVHTSAQTLTWR